MCSLWSTSWARLRRWAHSDREEILYKFSLLGFENRIKKTPRIARGPGVLSALVAEAGVSPEQGLESQDLLPILLEHAVNVSMLFCVEDHLLLIVERPDVVVQSVESPAVELDPQLIERSSQAFGSVRQPIRHRGSSGGQIYNTIIFMSNRHYMSYVQVFDTDWHRV